MAKRMGSIPTRAEYDSAMSKLGNVQGAKLDSLRDQAQRTKDDTVAAQNRTRDATIQAMREDGRGLSIVSNTTRTGSASIVSAIYANRPVTNVNVNVSATTVKRTVEVTNRYGTTSASRTNNRTGTTHTPL